MVAPIVSIHVFEAIGTHWHITVEATQIVPPELWQKIEARITEFDQRFSRFILTSEVNAWRNAQSGTYSVSPELASLLQFADTLRQDTDGKFDPAIGGLLELAGYDATYSFTQQKELAAWQTPDWKISGTTLTLGVPVVFDVGGYGKGTCIDLVAALLKSEGWEFFLIDGGGDLYGTTKFSEQPWQVAVEWPGKPEYAISQVGLKNQALAVSDIYRRSWGNWHHVIDPQAGRSFSEVIGCAVVAAETQTADALTTALALIPPDQRAALAKKYQVEFLLLTAEQTPQISSHWPGEVFVE